MSAVSTVEGDALDDWLAADGVTVLSPKFGDNQNPRIAALIEEIAGMEGGAIRVGVVDVSGSMGVIQRFGVRGLPAFVVLERGELLAVISPQNLSKRRVLDLLGAFVGR